MNLIQSEKKVKPYDFSSVVEKFSECDVNEKLYIYKKTKHNILVQSAHLVKNNIYSM